MATKCFLVLDDDPMRHEEFTRILTPYGRIFRADTAFGAITHIQDRVFDIAFLDHDLGDFTTGYFSTSCGSGMDVVDWLVSPEAWNRPKRVWVHSQNWVAAPVMGKRLREAGIETKVRAFSRGG